jgi:preprotein translocase SecE subunit
MAEKIPAQSSKKPKRKLRAAPTLREQAEKQTQKIIDQKPSWIKRFYASWFFAPFRAIGHILKSIWFSSIFKPIRFILGLIAKVLIPKYFRNSWKELRQVVWPDFRTTWRLTGAVLAFGTVFGLAIYGLDIVLEKLLREVLLG